MSVGSSWLYAKPIASVSPSPSGAPYVEEVAGLDAEGEAKEKVKVIGDIARLSVEAASNLAEVAPIQFLVSS